MHGLVAIVQLVLHYIGWAGIVFGIIAYLFGNHARGSELLISGASLIIIKYAIGFVYLFFNRNKIK
jgi:hypothetical protein